MLEILRLLIALIAALVLPGLPFAILLAKERPSYWIPIYASGLSLAINALVLLAFTELGVPFALVPLLAIYAASGLAAVLILVKPARTSLISSDSKLSTSGGWSLALLSLFLAVFFLRWLPLNSSTVILGIDTNHHVIITDLVLRNGAIPSDYEPYWGLSSFTYHFGFHANAAAFSLLSGLPPHEAVSVLGLYLIALAPLSVFVLTATLFKSEQAALIAAVITGLVSVFPAFYLNWGRFTQLAAVVVVPLAMALLVDLHRSNPQRSTLIAASLLVAGAFLVHYVMFVFLLYGVLALLAARLVETKSLKEVWSSIRRLIPVAVLAFVLVLPWLVTLLGSHLVGQVFTRDPGPPQLFSLVRIEEPLAYTSSLWIPVLALIGFGFLALFRKVEFTFLSVWSGLGLLFSNPHYVPGPLSGLLSTVTWVTIMFVFGSIFIAYIPAMGLAFVAHHRWLGRSLFALTVGMTVLLGTLGTGFISTEGYEAVHPQDLQAYDWIEENIPGEAVFATNVNIDLFVETVQSVDGGIWITYFTGRKQLAPILIYALESPSFPGYDEQLRQ
ncbi:MAG: DUF6541 family protein, partial [Candidatus Bathyarchaeia archaeon]